MLIILFAKWEDVPVMVSLDIYLLSLFLCAILSISSQSDQFLTAVQTLVPSSKGSISVEMLTAICCPGAGLLGSEKVRAFFFISTESILSCGDLVVGNVFFFFPKVSCCIQREPSVLVVELLLIFYAKEETI